MRTQITASFTLTEDEENEEVILDADEIDDDIDEEGVDGAGEVLDDDEDDEDEPDGFGSDTDV